MSNTSLNHLSIFSRLRLSPTRHHFSSLSSTDLPHISSTDPSIHRKPSSWNTQQSNTKLAKIPSVWKAESPVSNHVSHTFEWGLTVQTPKWGSKPTKSYIHKDYFDPPAENVRWDDLNEQWEVFWYDGNKLNAKPFPVRVHGRIVAKRKALKFAKVQHNVFHGKELERPKRYSVHPNIHYDEVLQAWGCRFHRNGRPTARYYAAGVWGYEASRQKAVQVSASATRKQNLETIKIRKLFHS